MLAKPIEITWTPDMSIFASEKFLKSVGDEYGWIGGFDDSGRLRCILPYTIIKKSIFRMARFRVETIVLGEELGIEDEKSFLNGVVDYLRSIGADMIIPATTNTIFRTYPDGADAAPYGTYAIDLTQSLEALFGNMSSSHRRKVRLAEKSGVQIKSGLKYLNTAYSLVRDTFKRSKIPFMGYTAFSRMAEGLGEHIKILIAECNGSVQGCVVIPFSNHSAYYVYGGSIPNPVIGATNLLHWGAIMQFKEIGVKRYDFVGVRINPEERSKQEGLLMFKQRFGGRLIQGFLWKYSINKMKYAVYANAVKWLRGGDIVDSERHKLIETEDSFQNLLC